MSEEWVREMTRPRSIGEEKRYGLGFWLHATSDTVILEGQWNFEGETMTELAEATVAAAESL